MDALDALRAAGVGFGSVQVEPRVDGVRIDAILDLALGQVSARFAVETKGRAPYPNELPSLEPIHRALATIGTPMLVVPFVSEPLGAALTRAGWSWADATGNFDLRADHLVLRQRSTAAPPRSKARRLPQGAGSLAIVRLLIGLPKDADQAPGPTALANLVGVSQPRASQVLHQLRDLDLLTLTPGDWWVPDREALLDNFLAEYRGPGGSERCYYGLDSPNEVVVRAAQQPDVGPFAVSADVGPDLLLAWRRPTMVVVYTRHPVDPDQLGVVEAQGRHDANVIVRSPDDGSVFPIRPLVAEVGGVEVPLADPAQQVWDLLDLGGADRLEAAGRLREWLLNR